jgi:hypothetical protein
MEHLFVRVVSITLFTSIGYDRARGFALPFLAINGCLLLPVTATLPRLPSALGNLVPSVNNNFCPAFNKAWGALVSRSV